MRIFVAATILGLLTAAAYAKDSKTLDPLPGAFDGPKADEQAYRNAIKRIPDKQPSSDPWGSVRDNGAGKNNQNTK